MIYKFKKSFLVHSFFHKDKGYKLIEAENCSKNEHILSIYLGWEKFLDISQAVICLVKIMFLFKFETNGFQII